MPDFGYNAIGEPVVHWDGDEYVTADHMFHRGDAITPVQVVGAGQVVVDARELRRTMSDLGVTNPGPSISAALAAAEPPKADHDKLSDNLSGSTPGDSGVQPAETDAPHGPTLAAVVKAVRWLQRNSLDGRVESMYADVAEAVEREAGGDGHEC